MCVCLCVCVRDLCYTTEAKMYLDLRVFALESRGLESVPCMLLPLDQ